MAYLGGEAVRGEKPPLTLELESLGKAIASGEGITEAREALRRASSNDHAVYDAAGIIGLFASMTKIVDFTGHYSPDLPIMLDRLGKVVSRARHTREQVKLFFTRLWFWN